MSERPQDPQPYDDEPESGYEMTVLFTDANPRILEARYGPAPRPVSLPVYLWGCLYVLATTPFARGLGRASVLIGLVAVDFGMLVLFWWIVMEAIAR